MFESLLQPREGLEPLQPGGESTVQRQFRAYKDSYDDMSFTPPHLGTIEASTPIVHGDRDAFFPVEMAMQMYDAIPEAYLWVLPNGGHAAGLQEPQFVQVVRDFLAGGWGVAVAAPVRGG